MSLSQDLQVNDVGTSLRIRWINCSDGTPPNTPLNLTGGTTPQMLFELPDASTSTQVAVIVDATGGIMEFVTTAGFLSQAGKWKRQARITLAGSTISSQAVEFVVRPNLV